LSVWPGVDANHQHNRQSNERHPHPVWDIGVGTARYRAAAHRSRFASPGSEASDKPDRADEGHGMEAVEVSPETEADL